MFKRILKTILNVILFICLVIVSYLTIIRGLLIENVNADTLDNIDLSQIQDISSSDIHKYFDKILESNDIPIQVIDEVLETNEHKEIINEYIEDAKDSLKNGENLPNIPTEKVESLLTNGIEKYNAKYGTNISLDKVKKLVQEFASQMETIINLVNQNKGILEGLQFFLSDTLYYTFIIISILLIIIISIFLKKEALFSLGGISIFTGIIMLISYVIFKIDSLKNLLTTFAINGSYLEKSFFTYSLVFIILGISLLILYRFLIYREEKKMK